MTRQLERKAVFDVRDIVELAGPGEQPFLHVASDNVTALRLYASLGFQLRRPATFVVARAPE